MSGPEAVERLQEAAQGERHCRPLRSKIALRM
jgi:hypothetical protein